VNNRALHAYNGRIVPDPGLRRSSAHDFADRDADERAQRLERSNAALENAIAIQTCIQRAQLADATTTQWLIDRAAADPTERGLTELGIYGDVIRAKKGDEWGALRRRVGEALDARPLPPEQASVAESLAGVLADAKAIGELYRQIADPNSDLSSITDSEFASRFAEMDGTTDPAIAYALRRRSERRVQLDQANTDAADEIRRATSKPVRRIGTTPAEADPATTPPSDEPAPDSSPAPAPGSAA
jgi:hypothetical protein